LLAQYEGQIAFKTDRNGRTQLYIMDADGQNQRPLPVPNLYNEALKFERFSPDHAYSVETVELGGSLYIVKRRVRTQIDTQLTFAGTDNSPVWSPTGEFVAYSHRSGETTQIWTTNADGSNRLPLTKESSGINDHPSWSPDGQRIAFWSNRNGHMQIWVMDLDGSNQENISRSDSNDWDPVWIKAPSPLSTTTQATPTPGGPADLEAGIVTGGCLVKITALDLRAGERPITHVQVTVNGDVVRDSENISTASYAETLDLQWMPESQNIEVRVWNTDYYSEQPLTKVAVALCTRNDPDLEQVNGEPTLPPIVVTPTPTPANIVTKAAQLAVATARAKVYGTATPFPTNVVVATNTPSFIVVTNSPTPENEATRSFHLTAEAALVFAIGTPTPTPPWIVTATNTPTSTPTPTITPTPLPTPTPEVIPWTPRPLASPTPVTPIPAVFHGKILFKSNRDGGEAIFVMNPDGTGIGKLTDFWPYREALKTEIFDRSNRYLVFVRESPGGTQVFVRDNQYNVDVEVTHFGSGTSWDPVIEPGGWRIAFVSNEAGNDEIYVVNRDGSGLTRLTKNQWEWDRHPSWSPDGTEIVFWSNRTNRRQLYIVSADGTNLRRISDGLADDWDPVWIK
jgi:Tol biopolymer transport system component